MGVPAFDLFPFDVWAKLNAAFWRKPDLQQLCYGDPAGDERLRGLIAAYLRNARGLQCNAAQIVITSGAQQAISLCAQLLVRPGDGVAIENPGYRAAGHAFAIAGAQMQGVTVDAEGIDCTALGDNRVVYVTPSHQYPLGVVMSLARRLELLAWSERSDGWIVEDDYDGEYRYSGAPWHPWPRWIAVVGCCTSAPLARLRFRRCAWAIWYCRRGWWTRSPGAVRWTCAIRKSAPRQSWLNLWPAGISSDISGACAVLR